MNPPRKCAAPIELLAKLGAVAPEHAERALAEARRLSETTPWTMDGYMRWCLERAFAAAPMPWERPEWEEEQLLAGAQVSIIEIHRALSQAFGMAETEAMNLVSAIQIGVVRALTPYARYVARQHRLRQQSWQRRRYGRAIKGK